MSIGYLAKTLFNLAVDLEVIDEMEKFYIEFDRNNCTYSESTFDQLFRSQYSNKVDPDNTLTSANFELDEFRIPLIKPEIFDDRINNLAEIRNRYIELSRENVLNNLTYPEGKDEYLITYEPYNYQPVTFQVEVIMNPNGHHHTLRIISAFIEFNGTKYYTRYQQIVGLEFSR